MSLRLGHACADRGPILEPFPVPPMPPQPGMQGLLITVGAGHVGQQNQGLGREVLEILNSLPQI